MKLHPFHVLTAVGLCATLSCAGASEVARGGAPAGARGESCPSGLDVRFVAAIAIPPRDSRADQVDRAELRRMPALHELMLDKDQAAALGPHDDDRDLDADEVRRVGLAGASFPVLLLAPDGTRCRGTTGAIRLRHDNDGPQLVSVWRLVEGCPAAPEGATVVGVRDTGETSGCAAFSVREVAAAEATHTSHGDPTFGPQRCHEPRCEVRTRATRSAAGPGTVVQLLHWSIADVTRPRCEWTGDERLETWVEAPARVERLPLQLRLVAAIGDAHGPAYAVGVDRGAYQVVDIRRPAPAPVRTYTSHHEEEPGYTLRPQCGG